MEETFKSLSDLQIQALRKGIAFDIDLDYNGQSIPTAEVKMRYTVTGDISKGYAFNTTFNDSIDKNKQQYKLNSIAHFISTVTGPIENQ